MDNRFRNGVRIDANSSILMLNSKKRALVAMSGGVDSSVAAALLARKGYDVIGVTMRLFNAPFEGAGKLSKSCCSLEDVEDARATCRIISAKHYYMNFEKEFQQHVIDYFVGEYRQGRTPHPCLACNDRLKFSFLMDRAELMDADIVATGHYAQIATEDDGRRSLLRGADVMKDQSYVLYNLQQDQLKRLAFPVGGYSKDEIREIARNEGLPVADKPDSQDICFIPTGTYREFVEQRLDEPKSGVVVDVEGNVLAEHDGIHNFTIGQRKGLPMMGGTKGPIYVTSINSKSGKVTVGSVQELLRDEVYASAVNWIDGPPPANAEITAKIRYSSPEEPASIEMLGEEVGKIRFSKPMRACTPGQAIVFYDGDRVLGGGFIELESPLSDISTAADLAAAA